MNLKVSSSTVVFVSACLVLSSTGYSQPRGSQAQQQANESHNFYITTPQTGEQTAVGNTASESAPSTLNTYTATTTWQQRPGASSTANGQATANAQSYASTSSHRQQHNNYYTNANYNNTATTQQTNYPSYVAHASATHATHDKKGLLSRLLPGKSKQQQAKVTQVSNSLRPSRFSGTVQSGTASWYGGDWHGKKTANGERYNMESMTAAHRTLPFGTLIKVRNERNGRECVVRINNRGPFTKGRILDLSKAAARQLGMVGSGVAKVKMEVLGRS